MHDRELFEKAFSPLHASPDTLTEVRKTMRNEKKTRRALGKGAVIAIAAALTLLLAPLAQVGRWCAPTLGASTMMETAGPVMLLLSSVLLLYFRKKYHSILREGRV